MKILVADDHRLIVEAVKAKLSELESGITFVLALTVDEIFAGASADLDLAIVDLNMPGAVGNSHIDELRRRYPALPVIVLSGDDHADVMRNALDSGVQGFIPKAYSPEIMISAVRLVLAGGVYVPPMMLSSLAQGGAAKGGGQATGVAGLPGFSAGSGMSVYGEKAELVADSRTLSHLRNVLTERQIEVLRLLSQGKPNKLIGRSLGISEGTVKIHLAAIFRALNVRNRTEAVLAAQTLTAEA